MAANHNEAWDGRSVNSTNQQLAFVATKHDPDAERKVVLLPTNDPRSRLFVVNTSNQNFAGLQSPPTSQQGGIPWRQTDSESVHTSFEEDWNPQPAMPSTKFHFTDCTFAESHIVNGDVVKDVSQQRTLSNTQYQFEKSKFENKSQAVNGNMEGDIYLKVVDIYNSNNNNSSSSSSNSNS
ncbi:hypothetical protein BDV36DRAFT_243217 [Aspergillus pseudocaelatus]|uniref:Uncharacterized protein n=1 Tax=Aspergillus pseudocaelatus TaxID=1825620 RepID=A0ABQ6X1T5_9EURO|nr:hypothetical protein BDV36DRAFT_243217 [Aspergillus pseudocaelatus]